MERIAQAFLFRGHVTEVAPGVLRTSSNTADGATAFEAEVVFSSARAFREHGTISFGGDGSLSVRTLGSGDLSASPDPAYRHGSVVLEVEDGGGLYEGAHGRITSNFVLSPDGEITDEQVMVLFLAKGVEQDDNLGRRHS